MAVYGIDFFGTAFYGAPLLLEFDARPFRAVAVDYGEVRLNWIKPSGDWTSLRLVRSGFGYPDHAEDGAVLLETVADTTFFDSGLREGKFYYYSVFVLATQTGEWIRAGDAMALVTKNHRSTERLFEWMPGYFQEADRIRTSPKHQRGPLERYLSVLGVSLDHIRTEYDSLRWLRNPDKISGNLLPLLAEQFGLPLEPSLGMRQTRVWLRDAVYLYRHKGTRPGIEAAISAVTGWGARVYYSKNLLRGEGSYAWYPFGTAIDDDVSPDNYQIPALRVTSALGNGVWAIGTAPDDHRADASLGIQRWFGIEIVDNQPVSAQAQVRAAVATSAGATFRWRFAWFDSSGARIGIAMTDGPVSAADTELGWTDVLFEGVNPPVGAKFLAAYLEYAGGDGTLVDTYVRYLQVEQSATATTYETARALKIALDPVRWNFVTNPSFEINTAGWEPVNATIERSVAEQVSRGASLRVVASVSGEAGARTI